MASELTRHFLAVWNPSYAEDSLDAHVRVLLDRAAGVGGDDDVYVWWGRLRSGNRQGPLPHLAAIREIAAAIEAEPDIERHLYLTDYRSLFVGNLEGISFDTPDDPAHTPPYYKRLNLPCDFWFRLSDIRRVVSDDLPSVIAETQALRNVYYNDRPVSLYGGIVDLPLVVTRADDRTWFTGDDYDLIDDRLWVEFDRDTGSGIGEMMAHLRDDVLGEACWTALEPTTQIFLATAERIWRDRRDDVGVDFSAVLVPLAKAVEVQTNAVLRRILPRVPAASRMFNADGHSQDMLVALPLSLGAIPRAINGERALFDGIKGASPNGAWLVGQWPPVLEDLARFRNPGAHGAVVKKADAKRWRDRLLGVGVQSDLVELVRALPKRVEGTRT